MQVAVTGSRGFRKGEEGKAEQIIRDHLRALKVGVSEFTSGAAFGVDTLAAFAAAELWPEALHRVVVPAQDHNVMVVPTLRSMIMPSRLVVYEMALGTSYMNRNDRMLDFAELLVAFPSTQYEQLRSGTWATVRHARARHIPLMIVPLDGTPGWIE